MRRLSEHLDSSLLWSLTLPIDVPTRDTLSTFFHSNHCTVCVSISDRYDYCFDDLLILFLFVQCLLSEVNQFQTPNIHKTETNDQMISKTQIQ